MKRCSVYSLTFCFEFYNHHILKTKQQNICVEEKVIIRINFNPRLAFTGFRTISEQYCPVFNKLTCFEPAIQTKTSTWSAVNFEKHVIYLSCTLEPAIWSRDTGQQIPCFDRCQLIITWMSNIKEVHGRARLQFFYQPNIWSMAAMLRDSVAVVDVVVRTRPRAMPLAIITMRKSTHGFPFLSHMSMRLPGRRSSDIRFVETSHYLKRRGRKAFVELLFSRVIDLDHRVTAFVHTFAYIFFFLPIK